MPVGWGTGFYYLFTLLYFMNGVSVQFYERVGYWRRVPPTTKLLDDPQRTTVSVFGESLPTAQYLSGLIMIVAAMFQLSSEITAMFHDSQQTPETYNSKLKLTSRLQAVIKKLYPGKFGCCCCFICWRFNGLADMQEVICS